LTRLFPIVFVGEEADRLTETPRDGTSATALLVRFRHFSPFVDLRGGLVEIRSATSDVTPHNSTRERDV